MEPSPPVIAKKLWNILGILLFTLRKRVFKRKLLSYVHHLMMEHAKTAMENLSCKPHDAQLSFVSPREYEFSCSNSPAFPYHLIKRKHQHQRHRRYYQPEDITTVSAVQKVLEMLNNEVTEASPLVVLPGFGRSPMVRQLRITDSPFPLRNSDEDSHVDKDAEEFIERFYEQLRMQLLLKP